MKKTKILFVVTSVLMVVMLLLSACGEPNYEKLLANSWYEEGESEPSFTLYKDGSCTVQGSEMTGTWELIRDGEVIVVTSPNRWDQEQLPIISVDKEKLVLDEGNGYKWVLWNTPHME